MRTSTRGPGLEVDKYDIISIFAVPAGSVLDSLGGTQVYDSISRSLVEMFRAFNDKPERATESESRVVEVVGKAFVDAFFGRRCPQRICLGVLVA